MARLEAKGEFPFTFLIEKAIAEETEKSLLIEGIASTTNIDHDNERMSKSALEAMAEKINFEGVPLRVEHSKQDSAVIGHVNKAWVDDRNQLHVQAELDKSHPVSSILHASMKQGLKMGLSVGGLIKHAVREFSEALGKNVKTFYDVMLKEVSVTPRPANYDSWVIAKSIAQNEEEVEGLRKSNFFNMFLTENPQLDYLQVFSKSIPDKEWRRVESPVTKKEDMEDKDKKEEAEKSVSRSEFNVLAKGINALTKAVSSLLKMDGDAMDQTNPDKKKEETEEKAKAMDNDAQDQSHPDKKKEDPEVKAKAQKSEKEDEEEKEKSEKDEDEDEEKEKSEKDEEDEDKKEKTTKGEKDPKDSDDYEIESIQRSIKTLEGLTKKLKMKKAEDEDQEEEKEKSEKEEEEKDKEKSIHPIDKFAYAVTKAMEAMADGMKKSGTRVLGFEKSIVDAIRNDSELQEEIKKMMKIPGQKRSVAFGTPFMVTKEGRTYGLTAKELTPVEKSEKGGKPLSFKDTYKKDFSSVNSELE